MPLVKPVVKIENVVACAALKHGIDLSAVVKAFPEVRYRPEQFPGLIFQLKRPRTTTLIFGTGKMVCTGARSEGDAVKALRKGKILLKHLKKATSEVTLYFRRIELDDDNNR